MKKFLALFLFQAITWQNPCFAGPKPIDEDEEDTSQYMISMGTGAESISSITSIRVKIFPHERDYLPHGKDEVLDQFTIRSEIPCAVSKADKDQILAVGNPSKSQNIIKLTAQELTEPVLIDCPDQFTLERNSGEARRELSYSGLLYVHAVQKQEKLMLEAINVLSLRGYLRGVVPSEVFHFWPMEALKTQAVAARTYAVYHMIRAKRFVPKRLWDVDDTVMYQAYTGISHHSENTDEAVFSTEGQILVFKGQVIQAFYHADSGGSTEEANTILNQPAPFTVARPEASDLEMNKVTWEKRFNLKELTAKLKELGEWTSEKQIVRVVVPMAGQTTTGRVKALTLLDRQGAFTMIPNYIFKRMVGGLPSNLYVVEQGNDGDIVIKGLGNGHGVGMSQMGATALAERKAWTYRQILEYYYVRTSLCSIDSSREGIPNCLRESIKYMKQVAVQSSGR